MKILSQPGHSYPRREDVLNDERQNVFKSSCPRFNSLWIALKAMRNACSYAMCQKIFSFNWRVMDKMNIFSLDILQILTSFNDVQIEFIWIPVRQTNSIINSACQWGWLSALYNSINSFPAGEVGFGTTNLKHISIIKML